LTVVKKILTGVSSCGGGENKSENVADHRSLLGQVRGGTLVGRLTNSRESHFSRGRVENKWGETGKKSQDTGAVHWIAANAFPFKDPLKVTVGRATEGKCTGISGYSAVILSIFLGDLRGLKKKRRMIARGTCKRRRSGAQGGRRIDDGALL